MSFTEQYPPSLDEAAAWVVRLQTGPLAKRDQAALKAWLDQSPEHAAALDLAKRAWGGLGQVAAVTAPAQPPRAVRTARTARRHNAWAGWLWAGGAAACAACAAALWLIMPVDAVYLIAPGHRGAVELADGTRIRLAGDTELHVRTSPFVRSAVLARGQAEFDVVHDARRPFSVRTRTIEVRDVGTRFIVRDRGDAEYVRLIAGRVVLVAPASGHVLRELLPGQEAQVGGSPAGPAVTVETPVLPAEGGDGQVRLRDTPLKMALKAFEWREGVDIVLRDPALAGIRVSGVYQTDNAPSFLNALARIEPISWRATGSGKFEVSPRPIPNN